MNLEIIGYIALLVSMLGGFVFSNDIMTLIKNIKLKFTQKQIANIDEDTNKNIERINELVKISEETMIRMEEKQKLTNDKFDYIIKKLDSNIHGANQELVNTWKDS